MRNNKKNNAATAHIKFSGTEEQTHVSPLIYGQYLEHLDDCIEPAIIRNGELRSDVRELVRDMSVPVIRWPGGCFADTYNWEDGIGAVGERPKRRNWHWGGIESNAFGTHEFLDWVADVNSKAYVNVNLGTGTLIEALRWLDYCNGTEDTADVLLRKKNGRIDPWDVRIWGIGNETWGFWEAGNMGPEEYASKLANWADFFKRYDSTLEVVGVGSYEGADPEWDRHVLEKAGEYIDYLSLHIYGSTVDGKETEYLPGVIATPVYIERQLRAMGDSIAEAGYGDGPKKIRIAVDEWNIRHYVEDDTGFALDRRSPRQYSDAFFAASVLNTFIRNADIVGMANYVFLVNGNGVIDAYGDVAEVTWLEPIFKYYRKFLVGTKTPVIVDGPQIQNPGYKLSEPTRSEDPGDGEMLIPMVDAAAVTTEDRKTRLALLNRSSEDPVEVELGAEVLSYDLERLQRNTPGVSALEKHEGSTVQLDPHDVVFVTLESP